jgi:hypothetical protein
MATIQELVEASMGKAMGAKARLTPEGYLHPEETFALVESHRAFMLEHGYRLRHGWAFRARLEEPSTLALVAVDPEDRERDAVRGCHYTSIPGLAPNADRPAERWFLGICPGMPATHGRVALTLEWIERWRAVRGVEAFARALGAAS